METAEKISGYRYSDAELNGSHDCLLPALIQILREKKAVPGRRLFDLGCGNGSVTKRVAELGFDAVGIDVSVEGVALANKCYPELKIETGSAYDNLPEKYGRFNYVLSLEVVEHLYAPKIFARVVYELLEDGGYAIISTPYHGYLKNLALALTGTFDRHFTALWDHGHIKFWSVATLGALLEEAGFKDIQCRRVGRIPQIAKSMIAIAKR